MCAFFAVTVTALFLGAESVIQFQSETPALNFTYIAPVLAHKSVLNILIFDSDFLDLTQHDFAVLVNLGNEFTSWAPNQTKLCDHSRYVDIALLGSMPIEMLNDITRLLCGNSTISEYDAERPPRCPLAMSETFVILAAASNRYELKDVFGEYKDKLEHLSRALLFLWFEEDDLSVAEILCQNDYYGSVMPNNLTLVCNRSNIEGGQSCLSHSYRRYLDVLVLPAPCYIHTIFEPEIVSTPFHNSSRASLNLLECLLNESMYSIRVSDWLTSAEGNYPQDEDFLLLSQSRPYYVITSDKAFVVSGSSKNPYLSPFDDSVWVSIAATLAAFIAIASTALYLSGKSLHHSMAKAAVLGAGTFLDQIYVREEAGARTGINCYARRMLLLSLTIPAIVLTNHYRSALHSEFTVTDENYLNIDGIEALGDFKLYLLLESKECEDFRAKRAKFNDTWEAGKQTCFQSSSKGECLFVQQAFMGSIWSDNAAPTMNSSYRKRLSNVNRIYSDMSFACINELEEILRSTNDSGQKQAFVASHDIADLAWAEIEKAMWRNPAVKFHYKQDPEDSFFISPTGFTFGMNLGPHQVWVRQRLRSLFDSGIQLLWARWERWDGDQRLGKRMESYGQRSRGENPITLENSWILAVIFACGYLMGCAFTIFLFELVTKAS